MASLDKSTAIQTVLNCGTTPYPAWALSTSILLNYPKAASTPKFRPSKLSIAGFGAAAALGGFVIFDGSVVDGAGFCSAWSALYLLVNGTAGLKSLRPLPILSTGLATVCAVAYGKTFFFPSKALLMKDKLNNEIDSVISK
ncbi:hypothetical protein NADFUDRAFT_82233 [Nadsonia fulvescens var. elongata DSM 6958]|uniref:Uncharacterized protein n=1 Tax=Nadsonia fulvescens var. elongata DSM 6958 TaxID=857566 RepID=A0A1E3PLU2_9ASCO|nr:hypothetical protein NADFUDRAFT_82233 [Nadsonia fulvescens var. elongata DSM 6958]